MQDLNEVLIVEDLSCKRGNKIIFKNISFKVCKGQILFVKGKNGSGKTTLLRSLLGILPSQGKLQWSKDSGKLSYLGHKNAIKENETVLQNLLFFLISLVVWLEYVFLNWVRVKKIIFWDLKNLF